MSLVLYPLSAFRAMSKAAEVVYGAIRRDGTQKSVVDYMQTRAELYDVLGYHDYERKLDELFSRDASRNAAAMTARLASHFRASQKGMTR